MDNNFIGMPGGVESLIILIGLALPIFLVARSKRVKGNKKIIWVLITVFLYIIT